MPKNNLLLVDGDTQHLRVIEVSLRKSGFVVTTARNGAEALAKMSANLPDLVITETAMPMVDGFELCKRMSQDAQLRTVPLVFLTRDVSVESKVRGLELGAEDYLIRPIYTKELITRVQMMLRKHEQDVVKRGESRQRFFGDLANMGVVDLLQAMEMGRKNGTIRIETPDGHRGSMWFDDGQLIDGTTGGLKGEEAVYRMLTWDQGAFEIDFKPTQRPAAVNSPTQGVIMEGMRRMDEWARIAEQLPPLSTVLRVDYDELTERLAELPDEANALIRVFDGRRSILESIDACGQGDLEALTVISRLFFEGVLTRAATELQDTDIGGITVPRGMRTPHTSAPPPNVADELIKTVTGAPARSAPLRDTAGYSSIGGDDPKKSAGGEIPNEPALRKTQSGLSFGGIPASKEPDVLPSADADVPLDDTVIGSTTLEAPSEPAVASLDDLVQAAKPLEAQSNPLSSSAEEDEFWDMAGESSKALPPEEPIPVDDVLDQFLEGEDEIFPAFGTEDRLTDEAEEESFFDTVNDGTYEDDDDFDFDYDEEEPKKGVNKVLLGFSLIILGLVGSFFARDQVEPFEPDDRALHSRWHEDRVKKQEPVGAVPPLKESWRTSGELVEGEMAVAPADETPSSDADSSSTGEPAAKEAEAEEKSEPPLEAPKVSEAANRDARGLTDQGIKLYNQGKYKGAIGKFEQALALSPGTKSTLMAYVKALLEVGRVRDSLEAAEKAARIAPKDAEIFLLLGNARQELGFDKESIAAYEKYLNLAPSGSFAVEVKQVIKGLRANLDR